MQLNTNTVFFTYMTNVRTFLCCVVKGFDSLITRSITLMVVAAKYHLRNLKLILFANFFYLLLSNCVEWLDWQVNS